MRDLRRRKSDPIYRPLSGLAAVILATLIASSTQAQNSGWTWTLYADSTPIVLAQEIPDTPRLKATLECDRDGTQVHVSLYDADPAAAGPITFKSGRQSGMGELRATGRRLSTSLPVDHPVFLAFQASGTLEMVSGERTLPVTVEPSHLPKLARFAEACAS